MPNRVWQWLQNAFAIESADSCKPNARQSALCDLLLTEIVRRGLTVPALLLLETSRPMNYVSAQLLHFCEPVLSAICDADSCREFARFLEHPGALEYLCRRLEELSQPRTASHEKPSRPSG